MSYAPSSKTFSSQDLLTAAVLELKPKITTLKGLSVEDFILLVEQCQLKISQFFSLPALHVHRLEAEKVQTLIEALLSGEGGQLIFRHGEQDSGSEITAIPDEKRKKIMMMQAEHNESDPITFHSAIEFIAILLTVAYLKENTGYTVQIESSHNLRARQPAEVLSILLDIPLNISSIWACINYPEDALLDPSQLDSKGNLAWEELKVDAVVGLGTFDKITRDVRSVLSDPMLTKTIKIIVTHTQQLDDLYESASGMSSSGRLSNYGFIFRSSASVLRCENGFYSAETLLLDSHVRTPSPGSSHVIYKGLPSSDPEEKTRATDGTGPSLTLGFK